MIFHLAMDHGKTNNTKLENVNLNEKESDICYAINNY
jgi:hypothetical protein